jgi:PAS domain S-box-containing protein
MSPSVTRLLGYSVEEAMARGIEGSVTPESIKVATKALAETMTKELKEKELMPVMTDLEFIRKDGSKVWATASVNIIRGSDGKPNGVLSILHDITERKKAEEALRESNEKLHVIFDSIGDAVTVVDLGGNIVDANKEALRLHAFGSKNEIIGRKASEMVAPLDRERAVNDAIKTLKSAYPIGRTEYKLIEAKGREFDGEFNLAVLKDDKGKPAGFIGIAQDISKRKQAEKELIKYKDHLEELVKERTEELAAAKITAEQANKAKSEFLANMSHEIRTPLSTIIGFSELLSDETKGLINDDQKKYLGYVTSSGHHLLSLINDILDLSKVEAGKMELLPTNFSISDLLKTSLSFIVEKALKHNIKLLSEISADVDMIEADERKVKQIMYNLLSNAVKFTPDRGTITISADVVSPNSTALPVKIRKGLPDTKYVLISVKDTGIGIAKKDQTKLFVEFSQLENPYTKKYEGTGLGLTLSQKLVILHGGKIWFESKGKDKGCTFYFILPLKILSNA